MQIVIEIPDAPIEDYQDLFHKIYGMAASEGLFDDKVKSQRALALKAVLDILGGITNGIPLPKGHGRILDEKDILDTENNDGGWYDLTDMPEYIAGVKAIIEADRENAPRYSDAEIQKMQELEQAELQKACEIGRELERMERETCEDEYIKVPKKALKYRTAGMVVYNAEWLKSHFDIERAVICGAQQPCDDAISREDVEECKELMTDINGDTVYSVRMSNIRQLSPVTPQPKIGKCKNCRWWKDSDGLYRRGGHAESQCPINRREVFEGNGYCYMFEPQRQEVEK